MPTTLIALASVVTLASVLATILATKEARRESPPHEHEEGQRATHHQDTAQNSGRTLQGSNPAIDVSLSEGRETFNPILSIQQLRPLRLFPPYPQPGQALVIHRQAERLTVWPNSTLRLRDRLVLGSATLYEVDVSAHHLRFARLLPSADEAFFFRAEVALTYSVQDPEKIILRNVMDARAALEPIVTRAMRDVARDFIIDEIAKAEHALNEWVGLEGNEAGFQIEHFSVQLHLDENAKSHVRSLNEVQKRLEHDRLSLQLYRSLLRTENTWPLLAARLATNPEDLAIVSETLLQERNEWSRQAVTSMRMFLDSNLLSEYNIEDTRWHAVRQVLDSLIKDLHPRKSEESPEEESDESK